MTIAMDSDRTDAQQAILTALDMMNDGNALDCRH